MHNFTVPTSTIRAILPMVPKKDVRYYLNGACFDLDAGRIVAADGHRMVICEGPRIPGAGQYIVPRAALEAILKVKGHYPLGVAFGARADNGTATYQMSANGTSQAGVTIDGKYPDYARVIPKQFSQQPAQYNADYLADARAALVAYFDLKKDAATRMEYNGGDAAGVMHVNKPGCFVVIMPVRTDAKMDRDMAAFIDCVTDKPDAVAAWAGL